MRLTIVLCTLLVFASCEARFDWPWLKEDRAEKSVIALGEVSVEDRTVGDFDAVRLEGLGKLVFDASIPLGTVRVKADRGLLSGIRTTVKGDTLVIQEVGLNGPELFELEFRVAAPAALKRVTLAGLGTIESVATLAVEDLSLVLEGMGKIDLTVKARSVEARQQGQGELVVRGTAQSVDVRADGLGRVELSDLVAQDVVVESNGLGEVLVYASEKLKVRANGLGSVKFTGHPAVTDVQTQGLTTVSAAD